eukprot:1539704-Rhodomonas_salina.6
MSSSKTSHSSPPHTITDTPAPSSMSKPVHSASCGSFSPRQSIDAQYASGPGVRTFGQHVHQVLLDPSEEMLSEKSVPASAMALLRPWRASRRALRVAPCAPMPMSRSPLSSTAACCTTAGSLPTSP